MKTEHHNGSLTAESAQGEGVTDRRNPEVDEVLTWLVPDLKTTLAGLAGAPEAVATAVVQLLPFGSRASLIANKLAKAQRGEEPRAVLELTPLAFEVMAAAAAKADAQPGGANDWLKQAREAADFGSES